VVGGSKGSVEISNDGNNAPLLEARHAPGLALQGAFEKDREATCQSPAVRGWAVCRMHGPWRGAEGEANGNYKTGEHTAELREARKLIRAILRRAKEAE
jgi:glucans biosynthesis protein